MKSLKRTSSKTEKLLRSIYLHPVKELKFPSDEILLLLWPLYEVPDKGDYGKRTMSEHVEKEMRVVPTYTNHFFYLSNDRNKNLKGLARVYVDDSLQTGNDDLLFFSENPEKG